MRGTGARGDRAPWETGAWSGRDVRRNPVNGSLRAASQHRATAADLCRRGWESPLKVAAGLWVAALLIAGPASAGPPQGNESAAVPFVAPRGEALTVLPSDPADDATPHGFPRTRSKHPLLPRVFYGKVTSSTEVRGPSPGLRVVRVPSTSGLTGPSGVTVLIFRGTTAAEEAARQAAQPPASDDSTAPGLRLAETPDVTAATARWQPMIAAASRRFGVPENWIKAVMRIESGGQATVAGQPITSRAGATGLMQVMPETFAELQRRYGLGGNIADPFDNILAGTAYLREMNDRFGYPRLFAAYNAGPQRLDSFLRGGMPLPQETVAYLESLKPNLGRQLLGW